MTGTDRTEVHAASGSSGSRRERRLTGRRPRVVEYRHCVRPCRRAYPHGGPLYRQRLDFCQEQLNECESPGPLPYS